VPGERTHDRGLTDVSPGQITRHLQGDLKKCHPWHFFTGKSKTRFSLSYIDQEIIDMSKREKSNKESKKQPLLTAKEKKAAKLAKKHAGDQSPLIVRTR